MSIRNIIFDLGGVLIPLDMKAVSDGFKKLGAKNFDESYSPSQQAAFFDQLDKGLITEDDFRNELKKFLKADVTDSEITSAWNNMPGIIPREKIALLKKLRQHYRLFLLSNTNCIHIKKIEADHVEIYGENIFETVFEKSYYSFKTGLRKPDKEIFELVINFNNLNSAETMFIDDTLLHVQAAASLGLQAHYLDLEKDSLERLVEREVKSDG